MRITTLILLLILLSSFANAAQILRTQVDIETDAEDNTINIEMEGGNSLTFKCSDEVKITQYLERDITEECKADIEECTDNMDRLSNIFYDFAVTYNDTIGEFDTLIETEQRALSWESKYFKLKEENEELEELKNESEDLKSEVSRYRTKYETCQASSSNTATCEADLATAKNNTWIWAIVGVVIGAVGMWLFKRPKDPRIPGQITTGR